MFSATATPQTALLAKVAGDNQTTPPNQAVPIAPSVKVTDPAGSPQAGVTVRFAAVEGGGHITGADAVSNASGIATVGSWTMGPTESINALTVTSPSGSLVTFTATATASGFPHLLAPVAGDGQTASPGAMVSIAPRVKVIGINGAAVAGVS